MWKMQILGKGEEAQILGKGGGPAEGIGRGF